MTAIYRTCAPKRIAGAALVTRSLVARVVYMHLLVGEVAGQVPGIVRVGVLGLAEETRLEPADVRAALDELRGHGLVEVDDDARLIRLPGVPADHNRLAANPKTVTGWVRAMEDLPASPLRTRHAVEMQAVCPPDIQHLWAGLVAQPDGDGLPIERQPIQGTGTRTRTGTAISDGDVAHATTENPSPSTDRPRSSGDDSDTAPSRAISSTRPPPAPVDDAHPGQRLKLTRDRLCMRLETVAARAAIPRGTLDKLERGSMQPTRSELAALAKAYGDPDLATLPAIDGDGGATLAEQVVRELHRHRVELELAQGDPPPVVAADVRAVFEPAESDRAAGRDLLTTWLTVIRRAAEEIRRERRRGKGRSDEFFRLDAKGGLGGESRRAKYLELAALDRREDLTPSARGSPRPPKITRDRRHETATFETATFETPEPEETT